MRIGRSGPMGLWAAAVFAAMTLSLPVTGQDKPATGAAPASDADSQFPSSSAAAAPGDLINGDSFDAIIASLERNGIKSELIREEGSNPRIRSSDEQRQFTVNFYSCTENKNCGVIQFVSGWDMRYGLPLARIEEWNATNIWGQAYRDDDKDPWLAMAVNLRGGVTVENFDDTVDWWLVIRTEFEKHIGWDKE